MFGRIDDNDLVTLRWTDPADCTTKYQVYHATIVSNLWAHAGTDLAPETMTFSKSHSGISWGSNGLNYAVWCNKTGGSGTPQGRQLGTVRFYKRSYAGNAPVAPGNLMIEPADDALTVSWDEPDNPSASPIKNPIVQYQVQWKSGTEDWDATSRQAVTELPPARSHTITGLTKGTEYTVRVRALSSVDDGAWSSGATAVASSGPVVTLALSSDSVAENSNTAVGVTAAISAAAVLPATGSAYTLSTNTTLNFAANATRSTGTVTITPADNSANDGDKVITVSGTVAGVTGVTGPEDVTLTITDDEMPVMVLSLNYTDVTEGSSQYVYITATLPAARTVDTTVSLDFVGVSATETDDYTITYRPGSVRVPANQLSGTVSDGSRIIMITVDDSIYEGDETLEVRGTATGYTVTPVTFTITDNDDPPAVSTDATLSLLSLSPTNISNFASGTTRYSMGVAHSVTVTPTANHAAATITVNGRAVASGSGQAVSVNVGRNAITILVTAQDGNTTKTYTVTVNRAAVPGASDDATLSELTLSGVPALAPAFRPDYIAYRATVDNGVTSTTVTAVTTHDNGQQGDSD